MKKIIVLILITILLFTGCKNNDDFVYTTKISLNGKNIEIKYEAVEHSDGLYGIITYVNDNKFDEYVFYAEGSYDYKKELF